MSESVWSARFLLKAIFLCFIVTQNLHTSNGAPVLDPGVSSGLYLPTDNVTILDWKNFSKTVDSSETGWLVEFYLDWCGFCRRYVPIWRALATSVSEWKNVVKLAVINCAQSENKELCRSYGASRFPHVRYFAANGIVGSKGFRMEKVNDAEIMREDLVRQLQVEQLQQRDGPNWPNLQPFTGPEVKNVWDNVEDSVKYIFLLFEKSSSVLGSEIILDFNEITSLIVRRVTSGSNTINLHHKIDSFPTLVVVDRNNNVYLLETTEQTRQGLRNVIREFMLSKTLNINIGEVPEVADTPKPDVSTIPQSAIIETDVVHQEDLEMALRYSIKQEIPMVNDIYGERMIALEKYINALAKYFPVKHGNAIFLETLSSVVNSKEIISGEDFGKLVKSIEDKITPVYQDDMNEWLGCKGSQPGFRGYTCGVWELFHTLTVNFAAKNEQNPNVNFTEILETMYGYVKHFFGCEDCSQHFLRMAERRQMAEVKSLDENILWLWEAHNEVNRRLKLDSTEDPQHPKIPFPSPNDCPTCRYQNGQWDKQQVLKFLKKQYSESGIIYGNSSSMKSTQGHLIVRRSARKILHYVSRYF